MEKRIVLAGGCFWGVEAYFKQLKGVIKTSVGYVNGNIANPTYEDLCNHRATHAEACEIIY
ncbi:MAG: peptide-methionine (S)-S-oxide reductase, partial [Bacilli bacterium]|nr:peptide-methionine (S)-S-oxide reductase [Bacilli bacterium]